VKIGRAILLSVMDRPELLYVAKKHIKSDDFQTGTDRDCWNKIVALDLEAKKFDLYSVCNPEYADSIPADKVSVWEYDELFQDCTIQFFDGRVIDFVNLVDRERSAQGLNVIAKKALDGQLKDSQEIANTVNDLAMKIYKLHPQQRTGYAGDYIYEDLKEIEVSGKEGLRFGIKSIDEQLGTMLKGQFILLAARPGTGKSSLFIYPLSEQVRKGKHVCLDTMEMTRSEMMLRIIANRANVMMDKIQGKEPATPKEVEQIATAIDEIKKWKLTIIEQNMNTTSSIDNFLTRSSAEHNPVEMLIIDHFGYLLPESGKIYNRYSDYTTISNEIKRLAKKHRCVILCLTQLNRIDDFDKPTKENMRDTGSLEQDADKIIAMWKDASDTRLIHVGAIKNRQGIEFETRLTFYGSSMQFFDY